MSTLTNYIVKGAMWGLLGLALGEVGIMTIDTIRMRKAAIKEAKKPNEDGVIDKELVEIVESPMYIAKLIKASAIKRVREIKKDPGAEICAIWGVATYMIGNWKGFWNGFKSGWDYGAEDVNRLMSHFRDKYPIELTALVKRALGDKDKIELSRWFRGDTLYTSSWVAEKMDLPKITEVEG